MTRNDSLKAVRRLVGAAEKVGTYRGVPPSTKMQELERAAKALLRGMLDRKPTHEEVEYCTEDSSVTRKVPAEAV